MAKCPKCKKEIDSLRHVQSGANYYDFWVEKQGKKYEVEYQHDEFEPDNNVNEWYCPECEKTLFTCEEKATKFLMPHASCKGLNRRP